MSRWRAVVPLNLGRPCKTRLAGALSADERERLVAAMARHVVATLIDAVGEVAVLSPERPPFVGTAWLADRGCGLNAELAGAMAQPRTVVVHADLPLLSGEDVRLLLDAAEAHGAALAPDRFGRGTNALARLAGSPFTPAFGDGSLALHRAMLPAAGIVARHGLGLDVDTPDDLVLARTAGWITGLR
ncbi:MAG: 2-phospho-L-lactate guanylyltransferase [Rhizorhabdus sp.]